MTTALLSPELLTTTVGLLTAILAFAFGLPQWFHLRRTGSLSGVSLPSVTNSVVSTAAWLVYGLSLHDVWVTVTSVVGLPGLAATFVAVIRRGADRSVMWVPLGYAALLASAALAGPWAPGLFPAVLGCSILWFVVPAALAAWRSQDVSGLARGTWWLLVADAIVALTYGLLADVGAYLVYSGLALTGAALVLTRFSWRWVPDCGECPPLPGCTCPA